MHLIVPMKLTWLWGEGAVVEQGFFFFYFPPLKPRCVLWSGASYSPKYTVIHVEGLGTMSGRSITQNF